MNMQTLHARPSDAVFIMDGIMMGCRKDLVPELVPDEPNISTMIQGYKFFDHIFLKDHKTDGFTGWLLPPQPFHHIQC